MEITFKIKHVIARLFTSIGKTFGKKTTVNSLSKTPVLPDGTVLVTAHMVF
jgi:hypothetical protein